jgi:hypothetical protein
MSGGTVIGCLFGTEDNTMDQKSYKILFFTLLALVAVAAVWIIAQPDESSGPSLRFSSSGCDESFDAYDRSNLGITSQSWQDDALLVSARVSINCEERILSGDFELEGDAITLTFAKTDCSDIGLCADCMCAHGLEYAISGLPEGKYSVELRDSQENLIDSGEGKEPGKEPVEEPGGKTPLNGDTPVKPGQDGKPDNGITELALDVCGDSHCGISETHADCPQDCNADNVPYSFFAIHFEINHHDKVNAGYIWQNTLTTVELANQYNVPLTIMFWPGSVKYALASDERIAQVREWQSQGHEIGLHNQDCLSSEKEDFVNHQESDNALYEQLVGDYDLKSGTTCCTALALPSTFRYQGAGRFDGRSSMAIRNTLDSYSGHWVYNLNMKAGYANGTAIKIAQYNTLNKDEIYGFCNHGEGDAGNLGGSVELIEWMTFLYEKDPVGSKRMTLSDIMEKYILPNNLVIDADEIGSSTDSRVQQCLPLARILSKEGSKLAIGIADTGVFNLGRCIQTGTYCELEDGLSQEQLCSISRGDYYAYVPTSCIVRDIGEYLPLDPC